MPANGAACQSALAPTTPRCPSPAPLLGQYDSRAPGYTVVYNASIDADAETTRLAIKYGFTPRHVWSTVLKGFAAALPAETVAALRCEPSILRVSYEQVVTTQ